MNTIERLALDYGRECIQWALEDERAYRHAQNTYRFEPDNAEDMYERLRPSQKRKQEALAKLLKAANGKRRPLVSDLPHSSTEETR